MVQVQGVCFLWFVVMLFFKRDFLQGRCCEARDRAAAEAAEGAEVYMHLARDCHLQHQAHKSAALTQGVPSGRRAKKARKL